MMTKKETSSLRIKKKERLTNKKAAHQKTKLPEKSTKTERKKKREQKKIKTKSPNLCCKNKSQNP